MIAKSVRRATAVGAAAALAAALSACSRPDPARTAEPRTAEQQAVDALGAYLNDPNAPARPTPASTETRAPRPSAPAKRGQCAFTAWVHDEDPAGTNLRAGPGLQYPVLATLPRYTRTEGGLTGMDAVTFNVVEARDGWFRITDAELFPAEAEHVLAKYPDGWIHGGKVDFALQTDYAFAEPDPTSRRVATSWQNKDGVRQFDYRHPDDCQGEWVRLKVRDHDPTERTAWARGVCGTLETSCDGVGGDGPDNLDQLPAY